MRFLLLSIASIVLAAQNRTADFSIAGVVVNSLTGEPVRNALVTLAPPSGNIKTTFAGVAGDFLFAGLAEGQYTLTSQKPGFTIAYFLPGKQSLHPVELKSSIVDVRLMLVPLGVIEGQVLDQYGDPAGGVNVIALSVKIEDGLRTTPSERSVTTNDQGNYRLWNVRPGKYYIKAAGKSGGTYSYIGENAVLGDTWESFAPVYAGGVRDLNIAIPLVIGPGSQARADIRIVRERAFKIRGLLGNFIPHKTVTFQLLRGEELVSTSRSAVNGATGRFEIVDVTPGAYLLRATQSGKARAEAVITVSDRNIDQFALTLSPAVDIKVILNSMTPPNHDDRLQGDRVPVVVLHEGCSINLFSSDRTVLPAAYIDSMIRETSIPNVLPGEYRVNLRCEGGYPTAVRAGRTDLLSNPRLTILSGKKPEPIEITVKSGAGALSGKLVVNPMPANPGILLVPVLGALPGPILWAAQNLGSADEGTTFLFPHLAPGDYVVYSFSQTDDIEFRNPEFLQSLRGGTSVRIEESARKEITVTSLVK